MARPTGAKRSAWTKKAKKKVRTSGSTKPRGSTVGVSADNTRHTGGSMGLKARNAGKRIGQK